MKPHIVGFIIASFLISLMILITSCTISLTNISTHGVASDLVDEDMAATADVKPVISVPLSSLP